MKASISLPCGRLSFVSAKLGPFIASIALLAVSNTSVLADLLAHWKFDEASGTVAHDSAGVFDGTLSPGGAFFVSGGISSNAISLNSATNGFVNMGNVLPLTSGDFSVVAWIKMNPGDTNAETIFLGKHEGGFANGYYLVVNQSGGAGQDNKATFYAGGLVADGPVSQTSVNDGNWHQVVGVYKAGMSKFIYVDGVVQATNVAPAIDGNTAAFLIGGTQVSGEPVNRFTGLVDDVQVYNHALPATSVLFLFQNPGQALGSNSPPSVQPVAHWTFDEAGGTVAHDSAGGLDGTLSPTGASFVSGGISSNALSLVRATNGFVNMGNVLPLTNQSFSIGAWIKMNPGDTSPETIILGKHEGGFVNGYFLAVNQVGGGGQDDKALFYAGGLAVEGPVSQTGVNDGNWHHVVGVYRSGVNKIIYVDGIAENTNIVPAIIDNTASFMIGGVQISGVPVSHFTGLVDDVQVYDHALNPDDILFLFQQPGKALPAALSIVSHPANQTVVVGETATFNVAATGTPPLTYQWRRGTNIIAGATGVSLVLTNVQFANAGTYSVIVSNVTGSVISSNAVLTVNSPPPCAAPAAGLVSWWKGENNSQDQSGANHGTIAGNVAFVVGRAGSAFQLDGNRDGVNVGAAPNLQLQDFSIEAWIKRTSASIASFNGNGNGTVFALGTGGGGYGLWIQQSDNRLTLGKSQVNQVTSAAQVSDTNWHHVAVTKFGTNVFFYLDGVQYPAPPYDSGGYTFSAPGYIGAWRNPSGLEDNSFYGAIDELAVYSSELTAAEIQAIYNAGSAGKCTIPSPPNIVSHPSDQTAVVGGTATFSVTAAGTMPLTYQWRFNSTNLSGATSSSLVLSNVQSANAGNYSVIVSNAFGVVTSSNAVLTVNFPPALVQAVDSSATAGGSVTVPVILLANGNENALGFSLNFDPALLTFASIDLGVGATGATLLVNSSQTGNGKLGVALALPTEGTFVAGTQQIVQVGFTAATVTNATSTAISFGDTPIGRQLADVAGNLLSAAYDSGIVSIAAVAFEGDVSPRPNGNQSVTITDWVLEGRYVAGLDSPTNAAEFQRADCAPRATFGNGVITVTDWVQVGRYAAVLDPLTPVGGPTSESGLAPGRGGSVSAAGGDREISVTNVMLLQNQAATVAVKLQAQGDENALGFSLSFDPAKLAYTGATLGGGAAGATLHVNASQAGSGKLGFALALGTGSSFAAGTREIVTLNFNAATTTTCDALLTLTDQPVLREVSNPGASPLPASFVDGTISVNPLPLLRITRANENILLSWPLWASNFVLQQASSTLPPGSWTNLDGASISHGENVVTLPLGAGASFYRLRLE